jgi:hypothetical protein
VDSGRKVFVEKYLGLPGDNWAQMSEQKLVQRIASKQIYGCAIADLEVPKHLRNHKFAEFGAFIGKKKICYEEIGEHMQKFLGDQERDTKPVEALVCKNTTDNFFLTSVMLAFYLGLGVKVKKIHKFYEYKESGAIESFVDKVTKYRRAADSDPSKKCEGENMKLSGELKWFLLLLPLCSLSSRAARPPSPVSSRTFV